jgi:hypothetical protein
MVAPESELPVTPHAEGILGDSRQEGAEEQIAVLRGATVNVDTRRASQVAVAVALVALVVTGVILLIAGVQKNAQSTSLRDHGVPVTVTVTGCLGLMGGTGANAAGYSCQGTYSVAGKQYSQAIPGTTTFRAKGSTFQGVVVPSDPKLLSTPDQVASQRASWRVFIVPTVLILVALLIGAFLLWRRHRPASGESVGTGQVRAR